MKRASITGRSFLLVWLMVSCCALLSPVFAQQPANTSPKLTGIVSTTQGQPIPGASIYVKGTKLAVATDAEGKFSIAATAGQVLTISSMGYLTREVKVPGHLKVDVQLQENPNQLGDVLIIGYGTMKKTDQSSAQVSISSADINKTINTTMDQAIQGRAAGVYVTQNSGQPGGGISVNIRGVSTINGTTEPLYVIDGVQIQPAQVSYGVTSSTNALAGINPSDIESMEILQGPSATAIYGTRATNGVVLITTKRGNKGGLKVGYNYLYSQQQTPKTLDVMSLQQFAIMNNEIATLLNRTPTPEFANPGVLGNGTNWQEALFKPAPLQKHQLTVSNSVNNTNYYMSGEYLSQDGVAIGSNFNRYSFRLNLDNQATKWLKLSTSLNFYQTKEKLSTTSEDVIHNAINLAPNVPVKNPDGTWGGATTNEFGTNAQYAPVNPVAIASLVNNTLKKSGGLGSLGAEVTIIPGLVFRTTFNGNFEYQDGSIFTPTYTLGYKVNEQATMTVSTGKNFYWNLNELLQYNKSFGKHDLGVMVSHEAQAWNYQSLNSTRTGFASNSIPSINLGNATGQSSGAGKGSGALESYLGRINYSYKDRYIAQLAGRMDGSSSFGMDNIWAYFPSASAAWRISQEPFMKSVSWISELKIRAEVGETGSSNTNGGQYNSLAATTTPFGTGYRIGQYGNPALQWELTNTKNVGFNLAILNNRVSLEGDFYIRKTNNLLMQATMPAYQGTNAEGAIGSPWLNVGSLENKGYALTLNTVNMQTKSGFVWKTNFNISHVNTTVTKLNTQFGFFTRTAWFMNNFTERTAVGQAPWLFYGYVYDGIFKSVDEIKNSPIPTQSDGSKLPINKDNGVWVGDIKYKDLNGDGIIDSRDQTYIGSPWPKFTFGFNNSFSYKGFDLNVLVTAVSGNKIYNYLRFENTNPGNINLGRNLLAETFNYARVTDDGDKSTLINSGTNVPRITGSDVNGNSNRFTTLYVEDGSYIRIKNVQLGYNLPSSLLHMQSVIKALRVSLGVQNLATFTKYKGYDPEVGAYIGKESQVSSNLIGVDGGRYPITRTYSASIAVDF
ncbi:TonB-dependent receptor [Chitinophaga sp. Cy-1792]|uniref:SusC/RagA family TonB-linked outer membrane protein n=1 Tax=Chitinophaga sp. Cy-1792 TaxID=2608339 RepID=UPI001423D9EC|nr:TonB-dependent receptor [Chitinophaga sp. Cy-1792]NIG55569.1 TonB-dependent receptor [Chitinophaga sp. Cy-1792]